MKTTNPLISHQGVLRRTFAAALLSVLAAVSQAESPPKPLGQATVTQINNDVRYKPATATERPAATRDVVRGSDLLRTGLKSQAELEFADHTITRLGSSSLFTFDPDKRNFELKSGVFLFDMPKGIGGGRIITPGVTAAIEGTAGIVSHRKVPQVICLAGVIKIFDSKGNLLMVLNAGQMFLQGNKKPLIISLKKLLSGKLLQGGLPNNQQEFDEAIADQLAKIKNGEFNEQFLAMETEGGGVLPSTPSMLPPALELIRESHKPPRPPGGTQGPPPPLP